MFKVHGVNDIRQTEIHTAEQLVPQMNAFEFESAIEKLKSHNSSCTDQIPAELIKAGGTTIRYELHELFISFWKKEELPEEWKELITVPVFKKGNVTGCSNCRGKACLPTTYKILPNILLSRLTPHAE